MPTAVRSRLLPGDFKQRTHYPDAVFIVAVRYRGSGAQSPQSLYTGPAQVMHQGGLHLVIARMPHRYPRGPNLKGHFVKKPVPDLTRSLFQ